MQTQDFHNYELAQLKKEDNDQLRLKLGLPVPNLMMISLYIDHILYQEFDGHTKLLN